MNYKKQSEILQDIINFLENEKEELIDSDTIKLPLKEYSFNSLDNLREEIETEPINFSYSIEEFNTITKQLF